jgi:uncharacterized protein YjiS (DUF1127 family)
MTHPIVQRYRSWRKFRQAYNRTYKELLICSDRELSELGISRGEIDAVARANARR